MSEWRSIALVIVLLGGCGQPGTTASAPASLEARDVNATEAVTPSQLISTSQPSETATPHPSATPTATTSSGGPCVPADGPSATVPYRGTLILPVALPLPDGATIIGFRPCPSEYDPGEAVRCPAGDDPLFVWRTVSQCDIGPRTHVFTTTMRCPDGSTVETESRIDIVIPGDCDANYFITDAELEQAEHAVFGGPHCHQDLDLNGIITANELNAVAEHWAFSQTTGFVCDVGDPTPTPVQ